MTNYINYIASLIKSKYAAFHILITVALVIAVVFGLLLTFTYEMPSDLQTQTGTVASFDYYDEPWFFAFFGYSQGSNFKVEFEDGSYFEATGICYDCIDKTLFENLQKGDRLTLVYDERFAGVDRIYAIEHAGQAYLALDDVKAEFQNNQNVSYVLGPCFIGVCVTVGAVLYVLNYKKNKDKPANSVKGEES